MPSAGKRTLSGWVMVILWPSTSGIVYLSLNTLPRLRGRVGVGVFNARSLEHRHHEVGLGDRADERGLPVDHRMRHTADAELVRELRELVRLDAHRPDKR